MLLDIRHLGLLEIEDLSLDEVDDLSLDYSNIEVGYYKVLVEDYSWARHYALETLDYLYSALETVAEINDVLPKLDSLNEFYEVYLIANEHFGSEYQFSFAVRSLQAHIIKRSDYNNVDDWLEANAPEYQVPEEWGDLSEAAGYPYEEPSNVNGSIVLYQ